MLPWHLSSLMANVLKTVILCESQLNKGRFFFVKTFTFPQVGHTSSLSSCCRVFGSGSNPSVSATVPHHPPNKTSGLIYHIPHSSNHGSSTNHNQHMAADLDVQSHLPQIHYLHNPQPTTTTKERPPFHLPPSQTWNGAKEKTCDKINQENLIVTKALINRQHI
jgi:hypothetical protein